MTTFSAPSRTHQAGEFNDIAYNFGVCPHGSVYELRGWNRQTGANGTKVAVGDRVHGRTGDPLGYKGKASLIALYNEAFRRGVAIKAVGHGSVAPTGTDCPVAPQLPGVGCGGRTSVHEDQVRADGRRRETTGGVDGGRRRRPRLGVRLAVFLNNQVATIDKELGQDKDAVVRRRKV